MKLSQAFAADLPVASRQRGSLLFHQGRVRIVKSEPKSWVLTVQGSTEYFVEIDVTDTEFDVFCECDSFLEWSMCKHAYAAALHLESQGVHVEILSTAPPPVLIPPPAPKPQWERRLEQIEFDNGIPAATRSWPARRQILYLAEAAADSDSLVVRLRVRERNAKNTGWNQEKDLTVQSNDIPHLPVAEDRRILAMMAGASSYWSYGHSVGPNCRITSALLAEVVPLLCRSERLYVASRRDEPLQWEDGEPWNFELNVEKSRGSAIVEGWFRRGNERLDIREPSVVVRGLLFIGNRVARLSYDAPLPWIEHLRREGALAAPERDTDRLVERLLRLRHTPKLTLPSDVGIKHVEADPVPVLQIQLGEPAQGYLAAETLFDYEGTRIEAKDPEPNRFDASTRTLIRRNPEHERAYLAQAEEAGVSGGRLKAKNLPGIVGLLSSQGWVVEAEGRGFRTAKSSKWSVSSEIDWFELEGTVDFDYSVATMPEILVAARKGEQFVRLGDGSIGLLPEDWLERFGYFAKLGELQDGKVRFRRNQALLLDAMLAAQEHVNVDETFTRIRRELESFQGIQAPEQPAGFRGSLRHYQREGVGWMHFLSRFGLGGCLADDMGVGKTAQVLARLEERRGESVPPSLAVVPRSLIFNWQQEAALFTPGLRVLDHTGTDRSTSEFDKHDLVLTTYGTLRRDIEQLRTFQFDYVILDEAQNIRNAATDSAKAVRLLKANHRLALTGTPVENRLNDLWSIFEFLNPGMLGSGRAFDALAAATRADTESDTRSALGKVLRPFILRRTKQQVASELPEKTEQTIHCELKGDQRKLYSEIRDHYRGSLLRNKNDDELRRSKIQVLEALLRLRQAACHPGLIDNKRSKEPSAKLDVLLSRLLELASEGNKALVFSQFTTMLGIVRDRLTEAGIPYEYLDGRTRDRQTRVERFQNDPECPLFLISLKAGGVGLNLTAAEYVFLLDPWWNPAVEQQAIDRAHRIGQTKPVVAYRLIAKDTVEEKVQELQNRKRDLVKALIGDENRLIAELKRDDLELLLS